MYSPLSMVRKCLSIIIFLSLLIGTFKGVTHVCYPLAFVAVYLVGWLIILLLKRKYGTKETCREYSTVVPKHKIAAKITGYCSVIMACAIVVNFMNPFTNADIIKQEDFTAALIEDFESDLLLDILVIAPTFSLEGIQVAEETIDFLKDAAEEISSYNEIKESMTEEEYELITADFRASIEASVVDAKHKVDAINSEMGMFYYLILGLLFLLLIGECLYYDFFGNMRRLLLRLKSRKVDCINKS